MRRAFFLNSGQITCTVPDCSGIAKGGTKGARPPPNRHTNHSLKKAKSVDKFFFGGVHVTCSKLKLIKYVSTEEKDDILEELDL
jgi:hypothetical protein